MPKVNSDSAALELLTSIQECQTELMEKFNTLAADVNLMKQSMTSTKPAKKAAPKKPKMSPEEQIMYDYWKSKNADRIEKETGKKSVQLAVAIKKAWTEFYEENPEYDTKVPKKFREEHPANKKKSTTSAKTKVVKNDSDSDDTTEEEPKKTAAKKKPAAKKTPAKKAPAKKAKTEPINTDTEPSAKEDADSSSDSSSDSDSD